MSWTVLAAAVTWTSTTACRAVAAATGATGPPAGGLAASASRRPRALCSLARLPTRPSVPALWSSKASPRARCCAILEAPAAARGARLRPPAGQGPPCRPPLPAGQGPLQGDGAQLPHPGAQRSRPRSVLRFLIIPEVLNIIAANLGGHRVRGLMTTAGSSDPNPGSQEEGEDRGRKEGVALRPSVHLSVSPRRLLKPGQRDP